MLFIVGMMLGSLVLLIGLRRSRKVPIWAVVAAAVFVANGVSGGALPGVVGVLAALAAFLPVAISLRPASPRSVEWRKAEVLEA